MSFLGNIFGGSSSSPPQVGTQTVTTSNQPTPWGPQQPYLQYGYQQAQGLYQGDPLRYYPGNTLADVAPQQGQALDAQSRLALNDPTAPAATNQLDQTLNGDYLSAGNPYFQNMVSQIGQAVKPQVDSQFEAAGRYGSGANANAFASALTNAAGNLAFQNYGNERQRQIQGLLAAPQTQQMPFNDVNQLYGAGAQQRALSQDYVNQDVNRFNYNTQAPWLTLQNYLSGIAMPGGTATSGTTTQPIYGQPAGQAAISGGLGGALLGSTLGPSLFGSSAGTGAGIGGLLGLASAFA